MSRTAVRVFRALISTLIIVSAPLLLGFATGAITGHTKLDETVVAALLPGVLTAVGGAVLAFRLRGITSEGWTPLVTASAFVGLFSASLLLGIAFGLNTKEIAVDRERELQRQRYAEDLDFREQSLIRCTQIEFAVNHYRRLIDLPPAPSESFCDIGPVNAR